MTVEDLLREAKELSHDDQLRLLDELERLVMEPTEPMGPAQSKKPRRGRVPTKADYESFRAAAGSWADVDTDKLIEDIYETRRRSIRPPVEL